LVHRPGRWQWRIVRTGAGDGAVRMVNSGGATMSAIRLARLPPADAIIKFEG
jgi:glutamate-1-semialdehyde aminotransferase